MDQETKPRELPITGNLSEIELTVLSETHRYFTLKDKRLVLNRPLDRDVSLIVPTIYLVNHNP